MGCVQQAVLEFDEEVRAPWRPRLVSVPLTGPRLVESESGFGSESESRQGSLPRGSRRTPSRVGVCRQVESAGGPAAGAGRRGVSGHAPAGRSASGLRPRSRPRARLRLTRRSRRFALVLALAAGVALGSWLAPLLGIGGSGGLRLAGESTVVVQSGDTLWSIASPVAHGGDVRAVVAEIRELNGLSSARLTPGQTLQLP